MQVFSTPEEISIYRLMVLRSALKLLAQGIEPNKAYTHNATLQAVSFYTGKQYNWRAKRDRTQAIEDIETYIAKRRVMQ